MHKWLETLRTDDYIKNLLVFFPAFFGGALYNAQTTTLLIVAFCVFCSLASGVYIINDCFDKASDSLHPLKRQRHIAAGNITLQQAYFTAFFLILFSLLLSIVLSMHLFYIAVAYLAINLLYSGFAKQIPIVDLLLITAGFVLRLQAGGIISDVTISYWLYGMTSLLAFTFGLAKRIEEAQLLGSYNMVASDIRPTLAYYTQKSGRLVLILLILTAGICYGLYTVSDETTHRLGTHFVFVSCIPVAAGIAFYLQILRNPSQSMMPQVVLRKSTGIQLSIIVWLVMMSYFIYN